MQRHPMHSFLRSQHKGDTTSTFLLATGFTFREATAANISVSSLLNTRGASRPVIVSTKTLVKVPVLTASKSMIVTYMRDDVIALALITFAALSKHFAAHSCKCRPGRS